MVSKESYILLQGLYLSRWRRDQRFLEQEQDIEALPGGVEEGDGVRTQK